MEKFLFNPEFYHTFYNCSSHTPEQWHAFGRSNKPLGLTYILIGVMYEVLYFPCLYVMASPKFLRAVFCDHPALMYISGAISTGLWCSACAACMLLALNRCCDLLRPNWMETLFGGGRTYYWLLVPTFYGLYFIFFTPPLIYTSYYSAAFFDPTLPGPHTANNCVVICILCGAYTCVCVHVLVRGRQAAQAGTGARHGMSIIAQATLICALILIAATIYVKMQFFETPAYMIVVGQVTWQSSHGGAVFIYLFLNRTMRREIMKSFFPSGGFCNNKSQVSTTPVTKMGGQQAFTSTNQDDMQDESTRY
ncbi:hypothetical protein M3Y99_01888500 [Aphelenchoides fujianensis]|nr:hypothetical protein M3Y99_01888500 [Aphelenchoides fujianensis]